MALTLAQISEAAYDMTKRDSYKHMTLDEIQKAMNEAYYKYDLDAGDYLKDIYKQEYARRMQEAAATTAFNEASKGYLELYDAHAEYMEEIKEQQKEAEERARSLAPIGYATTSISSGTIGGITTSSGSGIWGTPLTLTPATSTPSTITFGGTVYTFPLGYVVPKEPEESKPPKEEFCAGMHYPQHEDPSAMVYTCNCGFIKVPVATCKDREITHKYLVDNWPESGKLLW